MISPHFKTSLLITLLSIFLTVGQQSSANKCLDLFRELGNQPTISGSGFSTFEVSSSVLERFKAVDLNKYTFDPNQSVKAGDQEWFVYKGYIKRIEKLRDYFNKKSSDALDDIGLAIYPGSGTDSTFIVNLFPNAKTYLAVDNHVFANAKQEGFAWRRPVDGSEYRQWDDVGAQSSLGSLILSGLVASVPNIRIKQITLFGDPPRTRANALIKFDRGEGTQLQNYLFVNESWAKSTSLNKLWWSGLLRDGNIGIALKGSMWISSLPIYRELVNQVSQSPLGVVVGSVSELSMKAKKSIINADLNFGYGSGMSGKDKGTLLKILNDER